MSIIRRIVLGTLTALLTVEILTRFSIWWFGIAPLVTVDSRYGWHMAPNGRLPLWNEEGPYLLELNERGFRDRSDPGRLSDSAKVVILGGSNTVGVSVPLECLFSEVLEQMLPETDVRNLGCILYDLDQQYLLLEREVAGYRPDVVIQCISSDSDPFIFLESRTGMIRCRVIPKGSTGDFVIHPPRLPWWQPLTEYSATLHALQLVLFRRWEGESTASPGVPVEVRSAVLSNLIRKSRQCALDMGADHLFVYFGTASPEQNLTQKILVQMASAGEINLLDLHEQFVVDRDGSDAPDIWLEKDQGHLSEYGHFVLAEAIERYLVTTKWSRQPAESLSKNATASP